MADRMVPVEGFMGHPIPSAMPSRWKLEKDQWCWYVDLNDMPQTPFGPRPLPPGGMPQAGAAPPGLPTAPGLPVMPTIASQVVADKSTVELKSGSPASAQVTLINQMPRGLTLALMPTHTPGLTAKLDSTVLSIGGKAALTVQSDGSFAAGKSLTVSLRVLETNQFIPIKISFK